MNLFKKKRKLFNVGDDVIYITTDQVWIGRVSAINGVGKHPVTVNCSRSDSSGYVSKISATFTEDGRYNAGDSDVNLFPYSHTLCVALKKGITEHKSSPTTKEYPSKFLDNIAKKYRTFDKCVIKDETKPRNNDFIYHWLVFIITFTIGMSI